MTRTKLPVSEDGGLKPAILDMCALLHLHVAHFPKVKDSRGRWRTPIEGDAAGFPDLVIVGLTVLWRELKVQGRKPRPGQKEWIQQLEAAGQDVAVWDEHDLASGLIYAQLRVCAGKRDPGPRMVF